MDAINDYAGLAGLLLTLVLGWRQLREGYANLSALGRDRLRAHGHRLRARTEMYLRFPSALLAFVLRVLGAASLLTLSLLFVWWAIRSDLASPQLRAFGSFFWWSVCLSWGAALGVVWSQLDDVHWLATRKSASPEAPSPKNAGETE